MPTKHKIYDSDTHFSINAITRALKNESSTKTSVIQNDHNSERFTFELPRIIEGHDMSLCDSVQVHYINIDAKTKDQTQGVYEVTDMQVSPEDDNVIILSWLISGNATKYVGSLNFLLRFACNGEDGHVVYVWNTAIYSCINVSSGIYNGEAVAEEYADILNQWKAELERLVAENDLPKVTTADNGRVLMAQNGAWQASDVPKELPTVTSTDNDRVLKVVDGKWAIAEDGSDIIIDPTLSQAGQVADAGAVGQALVQANRMFTELGDAIDDIGETIENLPRTGLPEVTTADNGKIIMVANGKWVVTDIPMEQLVQAVVNALPEWTGGAY